MAYRHRRVRLVSRLSLVAIAGRELMDLVSRHPGIDRMSGTSGNDNGNGKGNGDERHAHARALSRETVPVASASGAPCGACYLPKRGRMKRPLRK